MDQPGPDRVEVHFRLEQIAGGCVADRMRSDLPAGQREHLFGAAFHQPIGARPGIRPVLPAEEDGIVGRPSAGRGRQKKIQAGRLEAGSGPETRTQVGRSGDPVCYTENLIGPCQVTARNIRETAHTIQRRGQYRRPYTLKKCHHRSIAPDQCEPATRHHAATAEPARMKFAILYRRKWCRATANTSSDACGRHYLSLGARPKTTSRAFPTATGPPVNSRSDGGRPGPMTPPRHRISTALALSGCMSATPHRSGHALRPRRRFCRRGDAVGSKVAAASGRMEPRTSWNSRAVEQDRSGRAPGSAAAVSRPALYSPSFP